MAPPPPLHPSVIDRLSPEYKAFHNSHDSHGPAIEEGGWDPSLRTGRTGGVKMARDPVEGVKNEEIVVEWEAYEDEDGLGWVGGRVKVGLFWPESLGLGEEEGRGKGLPVFIYFHGGGWVFGTPPTSSFITRTTLNTPCLMIVPRTRLAPEDPFPAHVEDGWGLMRWLGSGKVKEVLGNLGVKVDWERVALGGASAGANVAAVMANKLASPSLDASVDLKLSKLLLFNPVLDNEASPSSGKYLSWTENQFCPDLPASTLLFFRSLYLIPSSLRNHHPSSHLISPINAPLSTLARLPRVYVCVGGVDLVRDEGIALTEKVRRAKGDEGSVVLKVYEGVPHAYTIQDDVLEVGKQYIEDVTRQLQDAFKD